MAWHNAKTLNPIMNFWNLWIKGFQTVYRLPEAVDVLEEALNMLLTAAPTYMYTRIMIPWIFWVPVWGLPVCMFLTKQCGTNLSACMGPEVFIIK